MDRHLGELGAVIKQGQFREGPRRSWTETREKLGNETVFSTTKHLYDDYETWTPADLENRSKVLADWAIKRWPS